MKSDRRKAVSIRSLFLLTIILKIASSVSGWLLASPWLLGFSVPLALMSLYILLGLFRADDTISDEKFADSCYYLGFIFTLSSILVALLDIPSIATKLPDISVRFGAAMVSTVLGLIVRVYLVNFRAEFDDAKQTAEDGLLDSVRSFRLHLDLTVDKLREFQNLVHDASKQSVAQADLALQDATAEHARYFTELLDKLAAEHRKLIMESADHMKATTQTLANALQDYAQSLAAGSARFEAETAGFSTKLDARIERVTLPENYFSARLSPAINKLGEAVSAAGEQVNSMFAEVRENSRKMNSALEGLVKQTAAAGASVEQVREAVLERAEALEMARQQIAVFRQFGATVATMETSVSRAIASISAMEQAVQAVVDETGNIAIANRDIGALTDRQQAALADIAGKLEVLVDRLSTQTPRAGFGSQADSGFAAGRRRLGSEA